MRPFVVLNALRPGSNRAEQEARETLAGLECDLCPITIHERADYRSASVAARSAQELEPKGKAAQEIAALYAWLFKQISVPATKKAKKG
jgi:chromosome partitioning protein